MLQLQSALHAPANKSSTVANKASNGHNPESGGSTGQEDTARDESKDRATLKAAVPRATMRTVKTGEGCLTMPRTMTTCTTAEEELMLSDNYGPKSSSHLNELMKKVRTLFLDFVEPPLPPLAGCLAVCGLSHFPPVCGLKKLLHLFSETQTTTTTTFITARPSIFLSVHVCWLCRTDLRIFASAYFAEIGFCCVAFLLFEKGTGK